MWHANLVYYLIYLFLCLQVSKNKKKKKNNKFMTECLIHVSVQAMVVVEQVVNSNTIAITYTL